MEFEWCYVALIRFFQMMVQRMLSAKSLSHAQGGGLLAGYFKFAFLFVMILPGMIGRILWPGKIYNWHWTQGVDSPIIPPTDWLID